MSTIKDLMTAMKAVSAEKTKAYDTSATVKRIEGNIAWVHIPGGVDETPVKLTINAKEGDIVQVRVADGKAWLQGNATSPPTDDSAAREVAKIAVTAAESADAARRAALGAEADAERAKSAADAADAKAIAAGQAADRAEGKADVAASKADAATQSAEIAYDSAQSAILSANTAFGQLSFIEDIVGVLELLRTNGNYEITTDLTPIENKWYFKRNGSGTTADPYRYEVMPAPSVIEYTLTSDQTVETGKVYYERTGEGTSENPYKYVPVEPAGTEDPSDEGWYECIFYELVGIQESIQNYVSSQLAVTDKGLWLKRPDHTGIQTKVLLSSTDGIVLYGPNGQIIGKYGETAQIGDGAGFNIKITGQRLIFCNGDYELGFWYDGQLFTQHLTSVDKIDLGVSEGQTDPYTGLSGNGKWSWKLHKVAGSAQNNLYLKWMG